MRKYLMISIPLILIVAVGVFILTQRETPDPEGFANPTRTAPPSSAQVDIVSPSSGSIIYAEVLSITGTLTGSPQRFSVQIVTPDDVVIAQADVDSQPGEWSVEIPNPLTDEPIEAEIRLVASAEIFDRASVLLDDLANRPAGIYGSVNSPRAGMELGGDNVIVEGRASGVETITIQLFDDTAVNIISTVIVPLNNPYFVDDVTWQAEVPINGYVGSGLVTVYFTPPDSENPNVEVVPIVITQAAG